MKMEEKKEFLKRMHDVVNESISEEDREKKTLEEGEELLDYNKVWESVKARREAREEKKRESLKRMTAETSLPIDVKEDLSEFIDEGGDVEKMKKELEEYREEVEGWPDKLAEYVKKEVLEKKKRLLEKQLRTAARKTQLESRFARVIKAWIEGRNPDLNEEFKNWLDNLLSGTIDKAWKDEIVKFLKEKNNTI